MSIDAPVDPVGTASDGSQEVPASVHRTGWYKDGAEPGQPGNTVIVGHTWSRGDGVFDELAKLGGGDTITLHARKGVAVYRVVSVGQYDPTEFEKNSGEIYRTTGPPGLVLMTCGDFQPDTRHYLATTIVVAVQVMK